MFEYLKFNLSYEVLSSTSLSMPLWKKYTWIDFESISSWSGKDGPINLHAGHICNIPALYQNYTSKLYVFVCDTSLYWLWHTNFYHYCSSTIIVHLFLCFISKTPPVVTVLWLDSDWVVTIISPTSGIRGRLQNRVSVPPWFLQSVPGN